MNSAADVLLPLAVAVPLLGAALLAATGRWLPRLATDALAAACAAATAADLAVLWAWTGSGHAVSWAGGWRPRPGGGVGVVLAGERVGIGVALLAAVLVLAVVAYSWRYFAEPEPDGDGGSGNRKGSEKGSGGGNDSGNESGSDNGNGSKDSSGSDSENASGGDNSSGNGNRNGSENSSGSETSGSAGTFPALVLLFEAGMCGFALTGDLFNAFVFFELMGTAAVALTGYRIEDPRPLQGALTFGIVNSVAAYCTLLGIGLLYARTGELGLAQIRVRLSGLDRPDALLGCAFALTLTGLLVKSATAPFHFWLPDAHTVAPTPVCMLLSGVMVELGVYGVARVYGVAFSGPGGVPADAYRPVLLTAGTLTALVGAVLCWQQRHLKRLLAFSTVAHTGLFLVGVALLTPEGAAGAAVYVAGHAGVKAALFAVVGVLLDRYGSVDERELHGAARELPFAGALFAAGALALSGLPPFGAGLGKALTEHAAAAHHPWLLPLYVAVSAVTGGAVLRAGLRVFRGAGNRPPPGSAEEMTGEDEEPETAVPAGRRLPRPMLVVPALLLAASLAIGALPGPERALAEAAVPFTDGAGYASAVLDGRAAVPSGPPPHAWWTPSGLALGVLSTALAVALAALAVRRPAPPGAHRLVRPLLRLHSGRPGDQVLWLTAGVAALSAVLVTLTST